MSKRVLVVLHGSEADSAKDAYQIFQCEQAEAEAKRARVGLEVLMAPGWDQLRVIRKRLGNAALPDIDAVVVETVSVAGMDVVIDALRGTRGLVFTNIWDGPTIERATPLWRQHGQPFGTVSVDYEQMGRIQAQQIATLLPAGGNILHVTGPQRSPSVADRSAGMRAHLPANVTVHEALALGWFESDGANAFDGWYGLRQRRIPAVAMIAAHADELAIGARLASLAVPDAQHRELFARARLLGMEACPAYGRVLVDGGRLDASVVAPATTSAAIASLAKFWQTGAPLPGRALAAVPEPYPRASIESGWTAAARTRDVQAGVTATGQR
jgi:hypothetical protein